MILFRNSILLTAGAFSSVAVALAALDAPQQDPAPPGGPILPAEVAAAEADYEIRQQAIEQNIALVVRGNMDRPPEERRDLLLDWMREQRPLLEAQARYSEEIDALYVKHGVTDAPEASPQDQQSAALQPLAENLMTLLREQDADPEARREVLLQWMEVNGPALHEEETRFQAQAAVSPGPQTQEEQLSTEEALPAGSQESQQPAPQEDDGQNPQPPAAIPDAVLAEAPDDPELRREFLLPYLEAAAENEPFYHSIAIEAEQAIARSIHENE